MRNGVGMACRSGARLRRPLLQQAAQFCGHKAKDGIPIAQATLPKQAHARIPDALLMRRVYLDGVDQPFARVDSGHTAAWYLTDHLGSVRDVVDKAGTTDLDRLGY